MIKPGSIVQINQRTYQGIIGIVTKVGGDCGQFGTGVTIEVRSHPDELACDCDENVYELEATTCECTWIGDAKFWSNGTEIQDNERL